MKARNSRIVPQQGQALIGLIIAIAIIALLAAYEMGGIGKGIYGGSIDRANGVACGIYTEQIRAAIMQYKGDYDGKNPPSLEALSKYGVVPEMYNTPGCVYQYDPTTGHLQAPDNRPGVGGQGGYGGGAGYGEGEHHRHHHDQDGAQGDATAQPPSGAPAPAQDNGGGNGGSGGALPTTTVTGPGGMSIHVPTGAGGGGMGGQ